MNVLGLVHGKTIEKICKEAVRFMVNELGAERAMVLLAEPGDPRPPAKAVYGIEPAEVWEGRTVSTKILSGALEKGQPVMLMDAQQDFSFKSRSSIQAGGCRSVICVPVRTPSDQVTGLFYADHRLEAARFDYATRDRLAEFAEDFGAVYQELREAPPPPPPAPPSPRKSPGFVVLTALPLVLALLWAGVGIYRERPPEVPAAVASPAIERDGPRAVAIEFLGLLRMGDFRRAHTFLSERLRRELPVERFGESMGAYFKDQAHRLDFQYRQVTACRPEGATARAQVQRVPPEGEAWTWQLVREGTGWKLDRLAGLVPGS